MSGRPIRNPQSTIRNYLPIMRHLYVHIPFCVRRCSYCDFSIAVRKRIPAREYVDAVLGELTLLRAANPGPTALGSLEAGLDTIYLGGGTPSLLPAHLSLYGLTVEDRTPLARWISRGATSAPDDDRYADEYLFAHRRLAAQGYRFYEVSNACRDGFHSRHNSAYWSGRAYLGLGPAAHSYDGRARRWNIAAWEAYARAIAAGRSPVASEEILTPAQRDLERLYLALRTAAGLRLTARYRQLPPITAWAARGWVEIRDGRLACTPEGWLRLDALVRDLTDAGATV